MSLLLLFAGTGTAVERDTPTVPLSRTWRAVDRVTTFAAAPRRTTYTTARETAWSARPRRTTWVAEER